MKSYSSTRPKEGGLLNFTRLRGPERGWAGCRSVLPPTAHVPLTGAKPVPPARRLACVRTEKARGGRPGVTLCLDYRGCASVRFDTPSRNAASAAGLSSIRQFWCRIP